MIRTNHPFALVATVAALLFAASPALATPIHALGDQDPAAAGFRTGGGFDDWSRGWRFSANASDLEITGLGMQSPASGNFILSLFEATSGTVLAQENVTHTSGDWQWTALSSGIALNQGSEYIVSLHSPDNARYYFGRESTIGASWFPTGDIEYIEMAYCNNCAPDTLPTNTLSRYQYGVVDIEYRVVPEPNTALLMGLGLVGLTWSGSRRSPLA